jgi:putative PEP-CTERM system histidine kinase
LITFVGLVSHLVACLGFAGLALVLALRSRSGAGLAMILACLMTSVWAGSVTLAALFGGGYADAVSPLETLRTAAWIGFLATLLAPSWRNGLQRNSSFIVAVSLGFVVATQLGIDLVDEIGLSAASLLVDPLVAYLFLLARLTAAIGGIVLVHNLYVNASPENRWGLQLLAIGLVGLFGYDLNLYTLALLSGEFSSELVNVRGAANALVVPVIALSARRNPTWRLQLSRRAAFHTLSLGAVGGYLVVMSIAAYGLKLLGGDWGRLLQISFLFAAVVLAAVVVLSGRFRASARVWINKHFFAYKYDYREEWLRFIRTVSRGGEGYDGLPERVVQAVCAIVDSPGGVLYASSDDNAVEPAARWNYRAAGSARFEPGAPLLRYLETSGRIVNLDELRDGEGDYGELPLPSFAIEDAGAWLIVPLIHLERLAGFVVIERSLASRDLNWEDFDLLRTVGRQAASYIAEGASQTALAEAQKFDEFNRRFAFIMHDIKNLVSQLGLVARNAERYADNPEFRADMVATLQSATAKMNDMLARLAQHNKGKVDEAPVDLGRVAVAAVAAKRHSCPAPQLEGEAAGLMVLADENRLEQVFAHLLQNAIDATEPDGTVTISLSKQGGMAQALIADSGCGMSAAFIRTELFKPFRSTKAGGFGIGAYEAREILRAMGGRLEVVSREGEGSVFTITLPLDRAEQEKRRA